MIGGTGTNSQSSLGLALRLGLSSVTVADVFHEQKNEDIILVLAGVHAAAELVAGGPEGRVEFGFFEGHDLIEKRLCLANELFSEH